MIIQTFVFMDLETTGLIQGSKMPEITEMAFIALERNSLAIEKESLPRSADILKILLRPSQLIPLEVSEMTGIYNDMVENKKPFDDDAFQLLIGFINRLAPPVCLVAHYGRKFDYPILLSAITRIGKTLPGEILCIDSWEAFKALFILAASKEEGNKKMESTAVTGEKYEMQSQSTQKGNETSPPIHRRPVDFKLITIYRHLTGNSPRDSHTAGGDCLNLIICASKFGDLFIHWADQNAKPLVQRGIKRR